MKLQMFKREQLKKGMANRIRREGNIPAVLYGHKKDIETVFVDGAGFNNLQRKVIPGRLSTTVFTLNDKQGNERKAILKEIQYHPTTYQIQHLDFEVLSDNVPVNVNVPIECVGIVDCVGVKLGGVLRQVMRHLRVRCLPKDIPDAFIIDVKNMTQNESKRLSELDIPPTVKPITDLNEVAIVIAKR